MKITKLRVAQVRQFRGTLEIPSFDHGLNVFWGPNEAGKSTVVRAIRAAFLERYKTTTVDDLLPRGETSSTCSPKVEIHFTSGGKSHTLAKSFFHRKRCAYTCDGRAVESDEAEDAVATLLGFGFALKGASKAANWGIPGLLWIQQGDGHQLSEPVDNARDHLRSALESTVSAVASSMGDDLLARLKAERALLLTPETGKPRGAYADAITKVTALEAEVAALDSQISTYHMDVDRLAGLRHEHVKDAAAQPWETFRKRLEEAKAALATSQQLQERLKPLEENEKTLKTTAQVLAQQLQGFTLQREAARQREEALSTAQAALGAAQAASAGWEGKLAQARQAVVAADQTVSAASVEDTRARLQQQVVTAVAEQERLTAAVEQAVAQAEALARHTAAVQVSTVAKGHAQQLDECIAKLRELEILQRAAATTVSFGLMAGVKATLDGRTVEPTSQHRISSAAGIEIEGVGRIEVVPGQSDAAELARLVAAEQASLAKVLADIGAGSIEEVRLRQERHRVAQNDVKTAKQLLDLAAPKGVDAIRATLAAATAAAESARTQLAQLPAQPETPSPPLAEARAAHQLAQQSLDTLLVQHAAAAQTLARAQASEQAAALELKKARAVIDDAQEAQRELDAQSQLAQVRGRIDENEKALGELRRQIEQSQPDIHALEVKRMQASMDAAQTAFQQRAIQISNLEGGLEQAGANGLEDRRADLQAQLHAQTRRRDELKLRAEALQLLVQRLEEKRQALTRRLQAPLQTRLDHYLRLVFPGGSMALREDLTPGDLVRTGGDVAGFHQLSYGAQEQMALISRLAYADLLKEAGKPTLIILDDALVHSDSQRMENMQRILYDAAQRHQVLLFTCHRERWPELGVAARELRSFVTSHTAPSRVSAKTALTADDF